MTRAISLRSRVPGNWQARFWRPAERGDPSAEFNTLREKYGKHTVFLGASFLAHQSAPHDGERGHLPERRREILPGETARKRLGIPMFMGEVT